MNRLKLLIAFGLCVSVVAPAWAGPEPRFDAFYVFGDSLADNGNDLIGSAQANYDPPVPPSVSPHRTYYRGRFSNGPVAFEYLWDFLDGKGRLEPVLQAPPTARAVNFAFGGSLSGVFSPIPGGVLVPGLLGQLQMFHDRMQGAQASRNALFAVFTGAGEYLAYLNPAPGQVLLTPDQVVANIAAGVEGLYLMGARHLLVVNLPDLGRIPLAAGTPASGLLSQITSAHNAGLAAAVAGIQAAHPDFDVRLIDVGPVIAGLPATTNQTVPALDALFGPPAPGSLPMSLCLFTNPANCQDAPTFAVGLRFLYWDVEHPTTAVHRELAEQIYRSLTRRRAGGQADSHRRDD